tara:strand:+ start:103 stop:522 length:420 start_codon:yes stop_codon:yes gene_type:complete
MYEIFVFSRENDCKISLNSNLTGNLSNLSVGENSVVNSGANFRFKEGLIKIGKDCLLAQNISIIANSYVIDDRKYISTSDMKASNVTIGDNVWIGTNVVIMPGVFIGDNSIIGSSAVLTKNVPNNEVWGGIPARLIRKR